MGERFVFTCGIFKPLLTCPNMMYHKKQAETPINKEFPLLSV